MAGSSSGTKISDCPYRVFLSFRGPDTRFTFADHLYTALKGAGIRTFRDKDEIEKGKRIDSEFKNAIEASQSSVIVFTEDFASSRWCLEEVVMIMNRAKTYGPNYLVLPVFYHVDPTHVRHQTGSFGKAFTAQSKFREGCRDSAEEWTERVWRWRNALKEAADRSGMNLKPNCYESEFIKDIVAEIQGKVKSKTLSMPEHLTGIDYKVEALNRWLRDGSENVSFMVICGIGGIGKTTIARHAFNLNCNKFNGSCFLSNVREAFEKSIDLIGLQRQLISDISSHKISKIYSADEGFSKIKDVMWGKKVLLVLDDVEEDEQLQCLLGQLDFFSKGSKIMVTTRSRNLLKAYAPKIHNVEAMYYSDSIRLFSRHAFRKDEPDEGFVDNSNKMIQQCEGLPLALKVFGSLLFGKDESYWNATLVKLQAVPNNTIFQKLRVSYDALKDECDKELFLEISLFFVGCSKYYAIMILDSMFHATIGLENLKDRCLLEYDEFDHLVMHQMVRDMGRKICSEENPNNPRGRKRLRCDYQSLVDINRLEGTRNIEALVLDGDYEEKENYLETAAFKEMQKLRMLHITILGGLNLKGSYKNFPNKIRWLRLVGWALKSMPDDFPVKECVAIEIRYSRLTILGLARTQVFRHLKILDLSNNKGLTRTPEFSKFRFPNLEVLSLVGCVNLKEVDESIGNLEESLNSLNLNNCTSLRRLPRTIVMLRLLEELHISGCTNLEDFPENMDQMTALTILRDNGIIMDQMTALAVDTSLIPTVPILPWGGLPGSLTTLALEGCGLSENCFPRSFDSLPFLEELYLDDNPIRFLPECIKGLTHLKLITFNKCERLESLVGLPEVSTLEVVDCVSLKHATYQAGAGLKTDTITDGCGELIWLEHKYKPIPIKSIGKYLLDTFNFIDWEDMESTNITFCNNTSFATRKGPIQGVEEGDRILSIAFPGSHIPPFNWKYCTVVGGNIDDEGRIGCLRVDVPWCHPHSASSNMYDVTLCFVYSLTEGMRRHMDMTNFYYIFPTIYNRSKGIVLTFGPSWNEYNYAEESDEELDTTLVVSNWILGADMLQPGDELLIYLYGKPVTDSHVKVKKIACDIREISTSQRVPTQTTPYQHSVQKGDVSVVLYGNPDRWNLYFGDWKLDVSWTAASVLFISNPTKQLALVFDPSWNGYKVEDSDEDLHMTWIVSNWILGVTSCSLEMLLKIYLTGRLIWNSHVKVKKFACNFRGIDLSQQVCPVQATPHYAETMEDYHFFTATQTRRIWIDTSRVRSTFGVGPRLMTDDTNTLKNS